MKVENETAKKKEGMSQAQPSMKGPCNSSIDIKQPKPKAMSEVSKSMLNLLKVMLSTLRSKMKKVPKKPSRASGMVHVPQNV